MYAETKRAADLEPRARAGLLVERVHVEMPANPKNFKYLKAKKEKLGHVLKGIH